MDPLQSTGNNDDTHEQMTNAGRDAMSGSRSRLGIVQLVKVASEAGMTPCGGYMGYPPSKLIVYLFSYLVL